MSKTYKQKYFGLLRMLFLQKCAFSAIKKEAEKSRREIASILLENSNFLEKYYSGSKKNKK